MSIGVELTIMFFICCAVAVAIDIGIEAYLKSKGKSK